MKSCPTHLKRYKKIALPFWKYGRSYTATRMGADGSIDSMDQEPAAEGKAAPDRLADDLEETGPTYIKQVLVDGIFHADPHPGNVFFTDDGRIALLDLGTVGRTTPKMQENLLKILMAISEGKGDQAEELIIQTSSKDEDFDGTEFRRRIGQLVASRQNQGFQQINVGTSLLDLSRSASENGVFGPAELTSGACLLMTTESGFQLQGHPGLAVLCFLQAKSGGFWLVISISVQNHRKRRNYTC